MRILVLDNYDSFTYNLVQYLGELSQPAHEIEVVRNDHATADALLLRGYDRVIVSPGPCTPDEAGVSLEDLQVGRYHSLVADPDSIPACLMISATGGGVIQAVRHRTLPAEGVQFHPESVLTEHGRDLLANFLGR